MAEERDVFSSLEDLCVLFYFSYSWLAGWLPRWSADLFDTPFPISSPISFYFLYVSVCSCYWLPPRRGLYSAYQRVCACVILSAPICFNAKSICFFPHPSTSLPCSPWSPGSFVRPYVRTLRPPFPCFFVPVFSSAQHARLPTPLRLSCNGGITKPWLLFFLGFPDETAPARPEGAHAAAHLPFCFFG